MMFRRGSRNAHPPQPTSLKRRIVVLVLTLLALVIGAALLLTDAAPLVRKPPSPTAEQVGAARAAVRQFRSVRARNGDAPVRFQNVELAAMAAMASDAFDPDRVLIHKRRDSVTLAGSHRLPLGRWLNVTVSTRGGGAGFPPANLTVGSLPLSQGVSRWVFRAVRRVAISRGIRLAPLDRIVRRVVVRPDTISAFISLPVGSDVAAPTTSAEARATARQVRAAYCRLGKLQTAKPNNDFAVHVRRAFAPDRGAGPGPAGNRAYIIGLAMLTVDVRVGELVDLTPTMLGRCIVAPPTVLLHDRADLPKHWALSAALAAAAGSQFSQAVGEWKELADSLSRQSRFAIGDPTGFSFLDLAADRSGYLIAGLAIDPAAAERAAAGLAKAQQDDLLPQSLLGLPESISNAAFTKRFGDTRDPRFVAATARIDAELLRSAKARSGPLAPLPTP